MSDTNDCKQGFTESGLLQLVGLAVIVLGLLLSHGQWFVVLGTTIYSAALYFGMRAYYRSQKGSSDV